MSRTELKFFIDTFILGHPVYNVPCKLGFIDTLLPRLVSEVGGAVDLSTEGHRLGFSPNLLRCRQVSGLTVSV